MLNLKEMLGFAWELLKDKGSTHSIENFYMGITKNMKQMEEKTSISFMNMQEFNRIEIEQTP